jgi:heme-degrading monooxygenase HmoA
MISRYWSCRIKPEEEDNYVSYLKEEILPHLSTLEGFCGASIRRRDYGRFPEFLFISEWTSKEAIKAFAGEEIHLAVISEKAQKMMRSFDMEVRHYDLIHSA